MFQEPFVLLESYSNLMMTMKVCMESKIPGLEQVKREIVTCVPHTIFYHENSILGFTPDAKNELTPVNCS